MNLNGLEKERELIVIPQIWGTREGGLRGKAVSTWRNEGTVLFSSCVYHNQLTKMYCAPTVYCELSTGISMGGQQPTHKHPCRAKIQRREAEPREVTSQL